MRGHDNVTEWQIDANWSRPTISNSQTANFMPLVIDLLQHQDCGTKGHVNIRQYLTVYWLRPFTSHWHSLIVQHSSLPPLNCLWTNEIYWKTVNLSVLERENWAIYIIHQVFQFRGRKAVSFRRESSSRFQIIIMEPVDAKGITIIYCLIKTS